MKNNNKEKSVLEIVQIKIKLKDREIILSSDEAREVAAELNKLFMAEESKDKTEDILKELQKIQEREKVYIPHPIYIDRYKQPYWEPIWVVDPIHQPTWGTPVNEPTFTCKSTCLSIDLTK